MRPSTRVDRGVGKKKQPAKLRTGERKLELRSTVGPSLAVEAGGTAAAVCVGGRE